MRFRGSATLVVLLAVSLAAVVLVTLQSASLAQAAGGREAVARVRAKWAARAGLEATIARFERNIQNRDEFSVFTEVLDMQDVAAGSLDGARWVIVHNEGTSGGGQDRVGPQDAHARINISLMSPDALLTLPNMTEDQAASIIDWIDADDVVTDLGAEDSYYLRLPSPYKPRNAPVASLPELELIAGVDPRDVRGEDWNLNAVLDPNESDKAESWPEDNGDTTLDPGWSGLVTAASIDEGLSAAGRARLDLRAATPEQLTGRITGLDATQARIILDRAFNPEARMQDFIGNSLQALAGSSVPRGSVTNLDVEQIKQLLDECTMYDPAEGPQPGRLNINTCSRETLDSVPEISAALADALVFERGRRAAGFTHIMDLVTEMGLSPRTVSQLARLIDVRSNAYIVTARGRDLNTGVEVELQAVVRRTALPAPLTEVLVR
ncbi:MAG: helix-hairpin-helix domain-containing protein [Phycisphaerales bacterium]